MHTQSGIISAPAPIHGIAPAAPRLAAPRSADRVLMIVEASAAGTGRHVLDLSEALLDRGCDVHLIYSTRRIDQLFADRLVHMPRLRRAALSLHTAPHPSDLTAVRFIRRYMREHGPFDIIHGHSSKGGALARLAAAGSGSPAIYTLHGLIMLNPRLPRWKWALYSTIEVGLSVLTQRIVAVSPEESRAARKMGLGRNRVVTIPNGLGAIKMAPRHQARRAIGFADDDVVIGFIGRLVEQKAPEVLIEAFAMTARLAPRARLALVGGGPLESELRRLADQLGVREKIRWLGEIDARCVIAGFDLFALPSRWEGLPYVVLEAMAAGLPVVATTAGGVEILVEPRVNGLVVAPDDARAFADALTALVSDARRLSEFGQASLERVAPFTIDLMADRTLDVYRAARRKESQS